MHPATKHPINIIYTTSPESSRWNLGSSQVKYPTQISREMYVHKIDAIDQRCLRKLLLIKWYHHVRNYEVRRTTRQPHLFSLLSQIAECQVKHAKILQLPIWRTGVDHQDALVLRG